jgi:hypothetical protein
MPAIVTLATLSITSLDYPVRPNVNWSYAAHNLAMTMLENRAENRNLPTLSLFIRDLMLLLGIWTLMATVSYHYIVDYL